ncbi:MAG: triose-phosphate isomerase [Minisyncoccia bacterium]
MKKIVVLNWKMNPSSLKEAQTLFEVIKKFRPSFELIVAPPYIYLEKAKKVFKNKIKLASQNVFWHNRFFMTGEISPKMLKLMGVDYAIIGHSERRIYLNESLSQINLKIKACLTNNIVPILCIGEKERKKGKGTDFYLKKIIFDQLNEAFKGIKLEKKKSIMIAYEPIWAIGKGTPEDPLEAEKVINLIRFWLERRFVDSIADSLPLLYGGSVKSSNLKQFLSLKNIDGVLVGSASTNKKELEKILNFKF